MNYEDDLEGKSVPSAPEREISLGTGTVFGIFFLLAIVCAAFFGFGYSMGHRSAQSAVAKTPDASTITAKGQSDSPFSNFKATPVAEAPASERAAQPKVEEAPTAANAPNDTASAELSGPIVQPSVASDGSWMVQVSATTRRPDAEALTKVLIGKGFTAAIKPDADEKFHVRVGPFANKKDADTTRKLLVASGYKDPFLTPR